MGFFLFLIILKLGGIVMKKFVIEDDFWNLFPNAKIGVVICHGIDNSIKDKEQYKEMILQGRKRSIKTFEECRI